jgi:SAM-dependent methyltransferase
MDVVTGCTSCGAVGLQLVLALGRTPLANALRKEAELSLPEPSYPLDLAFCPHCSMVQILEAVPPEEMFSEYFYFSSFSDTMLRHVEVVAQQLIRTRRLGPESLVIEAASNDGYLLRAYQQAGVPVLGIEPAGNIAKVAQERGIRTLHTFFTEQLALQLARDGVRADVFHAFNVLAHVPDLNGFVRGIRHLLKDDGVAVIEAPYIKDMLDHCEFDTIYHEHRCYFSLTALDPCFRRNGLVVQDVQRIPLHGGSLQLHIVKAGSGTEPTERVRALLDEEARWGVTTVQPYRSFAERVETLKRSLCFLLAQLRQDGKRIAAYGASAKGTILLNYCGIGKESIDFLVDRSTVKQGLYTPGTQLRIDPPQRLLEMQPDCTLLLTWNFAEEIMEQQAEYRRRGGRFIVPVPNPRVV